MNTDDIALNPVGWHPCHRLIASRFQTVGLFDALASPEDLDVVFAIEALTNPRIRQELGQLSLVPPGERVAGPGASLITAAFTHLNPLGSRFSDGTWGVYYAADTLETAVAEVSHHRGAFLARTAEPEIDIDLRWIEADLLDKLHDVRGQRESSAALTAVYDKDQCGSSQDLGRVLRAQGSAGLVYDSVRRSAGQCVAIFKPRALKNARAAGYIGMHWNVRAISHWFDKGLPQVV